MTISADLATPAGSSPATRRDSASQWRLMWWQFRRHRLAMASSFVLLVIAIVGMVVVIAGAMLTSRPEPAPRVRMPEETPQAASR